MWNWDLPGIFWINKREELHAVPRRHLSNRLGHGVQSKLLLVQPRPVRHRHRHRQRDRMLAVRSRRLRHWAWHGRIWQLHGVWQGQVSDWVRDVERRRMPALRLWQVSVWDRDAQRGRGLCAMRGREVRERCWPGQLHALLCWHIPDWIRHAE